jgi:hypothetical protein
MTKKSDSASKSIIHENHLFFVLADDLRIFMLLNLFSDFSLLNEFAILLNTFFITNI